MSKKRTRLSRRIRASEFDRKVIFFSRSEQDDGAGNKVSSDFEPRFTLWAKLHYLRGGEGVLAGRLQNVQPIIMSVRSSSLALQINHSWECEVGGTRYAVKEDPRPAQRGLILEFLINEPSING